MILSILIYNQLNNLSQLKNVGSHNWIFLLLAAAIAFFVTPIVGWWALANASRKLYSDRKTKTELIKQAATILEKRALPYWW